MTESFFTSLTGSLLLSHPTLTGDEFYHSVVYISAHTQADGAMGFILNTPFGKTLGDTQNEFAYGPLAQVPLFRGGPVQPQQLMFAVMNFAGEGPLLQFGLEASGAENFMISGSPNRPVWAFLGYSGWTGGQLESELRRDTWVVVPADPETLRTLEGDALWRALLIKAQPDLGYLVDMPEDPSLN